MGDFWLPPVHTLFSSTHMFLLDVMEALLVGIKMLYYTKCVGVALVMQQFIYAHGSFSLCLKSSVSEVTFSFHGCFSLGAFKTVHCYLQVF